MDVKTFRYKIKAPIKKIRAWVIYGVVNYFTVVFTTSHLEALVDKMIFLLLFSTTT